MNLSTWSKGKKLLVMFLVIFFFVGVGVTVYLVQKQQEIRSHAQKATVISLTPVSQTISAGDHADLNVQINPGANQVNFVKLVFTYDPNKYAEDEQSFKVNPQSSLQVVGAPTIKLIPDNAPYTSAEYTVTLGVGSDPTKVVQAEQSLGTFTLNSDADALPGATSVGFSDQTQVRSVGGKDAFNENVLSSTNPATIVIGAGQCVPNQSTCSWDASDNATSYHYEIVELSNAGGDGADQTLIKQDETSATSVTFPSEPGKTYKCSVTAISKCGTSDFASAQNTCAATPTPTVSLTPTLTPTPSVTLTPTPGTTSTPTPTTPQTVTPTTPQTFVTATPIPTNIIAQGPTNTPAPTLPATGNPVVVGGIFGGLLFVLGGLALLFL